jgi:hypothetical protein
MKNSKVHWLIIECNCLLIILKVNIFCRVRNGGGAWLICGMTGGCFTDVLHSSKNCPREHSTEPSRLPKNVVAAWGAVFLRFHGVSNLCLY